MFSCDDPKPFFRYLKTPWEREGTEMELRGDLHVHTGRSPDSRAELAALVAAANRAGLDLSP